MKKIFYSFALLSLFTSSIWATTVNLIGDVNSPSFFGVDGLALASSDGDSLQIGTFSSWDFGSPITDLSNMGFSEFGTATIGNVFNEEGKLLGNFSDNTVSADSFNGSQIYLVITDSDSSSFGVVSGNNSSNWSFPNNNNGIGDVIDVGILNEIDQIAGFSTVSDGFQVVGAVPEPSAYALLVSVFTLGYIIVRRSHSKV